MVIFDGAVFMMVDGNFYGINFYDVCQCLVDGTIGMIVSVDSFSVIFITVDGDYSIVQMLKWLSVIVS